MEEELKFIFDSTKEGMDSAIERLDHELARIRAGKASPNMLGSVQVEYYGSMTPLKNVANVNTPDSKTLQIQPFEKGLLEEIEKGIMRANLGFNPMNDGKVVRISIPPLTEERRRDLVKQAKAVAEQAKVSVRNSRKDANDEIKALQKDGMAEDAAKRAEGEIQDMTTSYSNKVDALVAEKEVDIMTI
ncbi:MAG: ribosome recycling factor [Flavobacteriales bacterium]|jgi:ribosome recycling factor|nr:ribosome recycling factor [Flavobacteriales bacterium]MCF8459344.1 ribosome recycling factor [Flavobacteriales bacterium]